MTVSKTLEDGTTLVLERADGQTDLSGTLRGVRCVWRCMAPPDTPLADLVPLEDWHADDYMATPSGYSWLAPIPTRYIA